MMLETIILMLERVTPDSWDVALWKDGSPWLHIHDDTMREGDFEYLPHEPEGLGIIEKMISDEGFESLGVVCSCMSVGMNLADGVKCAKSIFGI